MSTYIDLEIIQSLPFSNANRDDAGQPKTVKVGGTTRGRLSSQSLKRAARFYGADKTVGLGINGDTSGGNFFRTRYVLQLIEDAIKTKNGTEEDIKRAKEIFATDTIGKAKANKDASDSTEKNNVLVVLTTDEINSLADLVINNELTKETVNEVLSNSSKRDIALWGRFFASNDKATLDGSAQVAHAFTTHAVSLEDDFFVGLDDAAPLFADHAGAGHPGDNFYLTGTFYKYANFNLEETILNLLNARIEQKTLITTDLSEKEIVDLIRYVTQNFVENFALSVPQGKIRSTAHQTLPHYVRITVRNNRPVNGATAFDNAIPTHEKNIPKESVHRLEKEHEKISRFVGLPEQEYVLSNIEGSKNTNETLNELITQLTESLTPHVIEAYKLYTTQGE
jgi:CRISPR system Cascade subunit CasC